MRSGYPTAVALMVCLAVGCLGAPARGEGLPPSSDPPMLARLDSSDLTSVTPLPGPANAVFVAPVFGSPAGASLQISGPGQRFVYRAGAGKTAADLYGHYLEAFARGGFQQLFQCQGQSCGGVAFNAAIANGDATWTGLAGEQRYVVAKRPTPTGDVYAALYVSATDRDATPIARLDVITEDRPEPDPLSFTSTYGLKQGLDTEGHVALYDLNFSPGSSALPLDARPAVQKIAQFLSENPAVNVMIVSHTSEDLSPDRAQALTRARALEIVRALTSAFGVAANRAVPIGAGNASPIASPLTLAGRKLNERVEVVIR